MPRPFVQVDESSRSTAIAAYKGGASLVEAAQQGGITIWLLRRCLKEDGVASHPATKRPRIPDPAIRAEIVRRYVAGESAAWLSEVYGCSHGCISKLLRKSGVEIRNRDKARPFGLVWTDKRDRTFYMRSSWEVKVGYWLDLQDKIWDYEVRSFDIGGGHTYTPDFWIYTNDGVLEMIVDVKGQWTEKSRTAITAFRSLNPGVPFSIWEEAQLVERRILDLMPTNVKNMNSGPRFRIRRELRKRILDLYAAGYSAKRIAPMVGRHSTSVLQIIQRSGVVRSMSEAAKLRHGVNQEDYDRMAIAYANGASLTESAGVASVSLSTAHKEMKRRGLLRTRSEEN